MSWTFAFVIFQVIPVSGGAPLLVDLRAVPAELLHGQPGGLPHHPEDGDTHQLSRAAAEPTTCQDRQLSRSNSGFYSGRKMQIDILSD